MSCGYDPFKWADEYGSYEEMYEENAMTKIEIDLDAITARRDELMDLKARYAFEQKQVEKEMEKLYLTQIVPAIENGLCATVLTQLSDVEDETNGLLTYDRKVVKIDTAKMQKISKAIMDAHQKKHSKG